MRSKIILGMLKYILLDLPNETTAPFWKRASCIPGRSGLFGKCYESVLNILVAYKAFYSASSSISGVGTLLFSFLAAAFLRGMLSVQIPSVVGVSPAILATFADVDVDSSYSKSVRNANGKETGDSRSIRPIRKDFGNRSESVREEYDVILNQISQIRCDIKPNKPD